MTPELKHKLKNAIQGYALNLVEYELKRQALNANPTDETRGNFLEANTNFGVSQWVLDDVIKEIERG